MKQARMYLFLVTLCILGMPLMSFGQVQHLPISTLIDDANFPAGVWYFQDPATLNTLYFDTAGKRAKSSGLDLGTEVEGSVTVRPLADGQAHVSVVIHTTHAVCFGMAWAEEYPPAFGYSFPEVRDGEGALSFSFGDGLMTIEYVMPSVDSSVAEFFWGDWQSQTVVINCSGELRAGSGYPDGTPGRAHTTQKWLPLNCPAGDCWPTENVEFKRVGK